MRAHLLTKDYSAGETTKYAIIYRDIESMIDIIFRDRSIVLRYNVEASVLEWLVGTVRQEL